jgi:hypothetical protein
MNPITKILLENCKTFSDRRELFGLTEAEMNGVNNNMINKLFDSALSKSHIDFEDIPRSKGDITKYSGYKPMVESLEVLKNISTKSNHKIEEIEIIEKALDGVIAHRNLFERGIKLNKDYVILQYNTVVMSCVIATSSLITSYVDFMKRIDKVEFTIINPKETPGRICIDNLVRFNKSVASGDFAKVMNGIIASGAEGFTGTGAIIAGAIIGGAIIGVTFMRDIVFYVYYSRVKLADYLRTQALFLELNKSIINAQGYDMPATKKEKVLKNQSVLIDDLRAMAEKIDVSDRLASSNMKTEIKKENSGWKLDDIKTQNASTDNNGYQLI